MVESPASTGGPPARFVPALGFATLSALYLRAGRTAAARVGREVDATSERTSDMLAEETEGRRTV